MACMYGEYHSGCILPSAIRYKPPRYDWCIDDSSTPASTTRDQDLVMIVQHPLAEFLPGQLLDQRRRELKYQHRRVRHDADANVEQHRAVVPHHDGMPEAPRQPDLVQVADADRHVAEERDQDGRAQDGPVALHAQQVNRGADAEARRRQPDAAQRSEPDPQAPRHLVAQVRAGPEAFEEPNISRIKTGDKNDSYDDAPQGNFGFDSRDHG